MGNKAISFFRTQSRKASFLNTLGEASFYLSGNISQSFYATLNESSIFLSGSKQQAFISTLGQSPIFLTANKNIAFVVTPNPNVPRLLIPRTSLDLNIDQTQVTVNDITGLYDPNDPALNPGGFNPETEQPDAYRPKRSAVYLWTVYKLRSVNSVASGTTITFYGDNTITPASQAEQEDNPYVYTLTLPTTKVNGVDTVIKGLYEIIMIVAPNGTPYPYGDVNLATQAQTFPNWYVVSNPIVVDSDVINCLNKLRYEYVKGIMCGKCDDKYLEVYAIYVGLLNAMQVGEWVKANEYYETLKTICTEVGCDSCSCNC